MNIIIAGDFYISDDFLKKDLIDKSVIDLFKKSEYSIINLEAPLTPDNSNEKILKTGPHLRSTSGTVIPYLKQLKIDAVTLANNHIMDYGVKGLIDTIDSLSGSGIKCMGVGQDIIEASKAFTIDEGEMKIAILNFCDNEWSIATRNSPGANPIDIIENIKQITESKKTHEKVICIIHGGHEFYEFPSPWMQKQYRFYIDNGADAVIGHHTHYIGGYEIYKKAPIIYSLGNFLFTQPNVRDGWFNGLVAKLSVKKNKPITHELTFVYQDKNNFYLKRMHENASEEVKKRLYVINEVIKNDDLLNKKWIEFVLSNMQLYSKRISPVSTIKNRYLKYALDKLIFKKLYSNSQFLAILLNILRSDAHYDILKNVIEQSLHKSIQPTNRAR